MRMVKGGKQGAQYQDAAVVSLTPMVCADTLHSGTPSGRGSGGRGADDTVRGVWDVCS